MTNILIDKFKLWQKPQNTNLMIGHEGTKVSWLALFFDIFFVFAIAAVGHILAKDMTTHGLVQYVITFVLVWWIWITVTEGSEYETEYTG